MTSISIDSIRTDGGTQTRERIDPTTVDSYAEDMKGGALFPPVIVFYDGAAYWLADGFHRLAAAKSIGVGNFECDVRQGDRRAAILYSAGANATNGHERTRADKRRAVSMLLSDDEWSAKSDRWIAEKCKVDHKTVGAVRNQLGKFPGSQQHDENTAKREDNSPTARTGRPPKAAARETRTGQDGKRRRIVIHNSTTPAQPPNGKAQISQESNGKAIETEKRNAWVLALHNDGLGTTEIARHINIPSTTVSMIKSKLGIAGSSPRIKLWSSIERLIDMLTGAAPEVERMSEAVNDTDVNVSNKEIASCVRNLQQSMAAIRLLARALRNLLQKRMGAQSAEQPPEEAEAMTTSD